MCSARRLRLFYPKQPNQPLSESAYCAHVVATQAETVDGMEVVWQRRPTDMRDTATVVRSIVVDPLTRRNRLTYRAYSEPWPHARARDRTPLSAARRPRHGHIQ